MARGLSGPPGDAKSANRNFHPRRTRERRFWKRWSDIRKRLVSGFILDRWIKGRTVWAKWPRNGEEYQGTVEKTSDTGYASSGEMETPPCGLTSRMCGPNAPPKVRCDLAASRVRPMSEFFHNNAYANAAKSIKIVAGSSGRVGLGFGDALEFKQHFLEVLGEIAHHPAVAQQL